MKGKHEGNYNPYLEQRDREFMKAYRKATERLLNEKGSMSLYEALNIARNSPTTRYFVSEQRASDIIKSLEAYSKLVGRMSTGELPSRKVEDPMRNFIYQRRRMYTHLYVVYKKLKSQFPNTPHEELVVMACATPAEEFYMTIESAKTIHGRIIKNMKDYGVISSRHHFRVKRDLNKRMK